MSSAAIFVWRFKGYAQNQDTSLCSYEMNLWSADQNDYHKNDHPGTTCRARYLL